MIRLSVEEVQQQLPDVLAHIRRGETVEIHPKSGEPYRLMAIPVPNNESESWQGFPKAGSLKGKIWMSDDFDAEIDEFRETME